MTDAVLVALLSLAGTLGGSLAGILTANKLVVYRLSQLEKKVEAHNHLVERMTKAEDQLNFLGHQIDDLEHRGVNR